MSRKADGTTIDPDSVPDINLPKGASERGVMEAFKKHLKGEPQGSTGKGKGEGKHPVEDDPEDDPEDDLDEDYDEEEQDEEVDEEGDEEPEDDSEDEAEEEAEEPEPKPKKSRVVEDDDDFTYKFDGKDHVVKAKDVRRLVGQEAALTQKSQETSQLRDHYLTSLSDLLGREQKKLEYYNTIDFDLLARNPAITDDEIKALKSEKAELESNIAYLTGEKERTREQVSKEDQEKFYKDARAAKAQLEDVNSEFHIPEWSPKVYQELFEFGSRFGIKESDYIKITNAGDFKLLWMAKQFLDAKNKVPPRLKPKVKSVANKTLKPNSADVEAGSEGIDTSMKRLRKTGSMDDATSVFKNILRRR